LSTFPAGSRGGVACTYVSAAINGERGGMSAKNRTDFGFIDAGLETKQELSQ
jgi:hypothetical protein